VNVTGKITLGSIPVSRRRATRRFIANDFPVPGPATTRILEFVEEAMAYGGVSAAIPSDQDITLPSYYFSSIN
jgi:hypothetical protein